MTSKSDDMVSRRAPAHFFLSHYRSRLGYVFSFRYSLTPLANTVCCSDLLFRIPCADCPRLGVTDPESWRLSQMHSFSGHGLERHHARVRRDHEFEDAFAQFYDLGQSLKEPIHITFLDQFGQEEAGIDGGGVTKEFLTSVTNQAFSKQEGVRLFVENEHHFLFPNPSALDEERELLKAAGLKETSEDFHSRISDMLRQYEFLGRIIGKCLYEGILVSERASSHSVPCYCYPRLEHPFGFPYLCLLQYMLYAVCCLLSAVCGVEYIRLTIHI